MGGRVGFTHRESLVLFIKVKGRLSKGGGHLQQMPARGRSQGLCLGWHTFHHVSLAASWIVALHVRAITVYIHMYSNVALQDAVVRERLFPRRGNPCK